ncbi:MAG: hypothetical protein B7X31_05390 [Thiomonas sp. 13-66-29]|jgi:hypothetical protein|nr:MAG: hypothetical protein B7X31_05390 [Thiomonas sp. 13-66-29]
MIKKTEAAEAAAFSSRAQKLLQQTQAKNQALLDLATKTKAVSQPAPAPRRPKPQAVAESPPPPRPAMPRAGQGSEVMSFPESEELAFVVNGGTFMAATVALLLAAGQAAARDEDDEGEAE